VGGEVSGKSPDHPGRAPSRCHDALSKRSERSRKGQCRRGAGSRPSTLTIRRWPSLARRVEAANNLKADLFPSIHHDSVPDKMMEKWEFEGKKSYFSDRFSGYGLFVSKSNPDLEDSLRFAKLIGMQLRAQGIKFAD
jgi:N-acetylmuramoyl-L-alanine amidase